MKRLLLAGLMAVAGVAHATSYEQTNDAIEQCKMFGRIGALYQDMATKGERPTKHLESWQEVIRQHIEDTIYARPEAYDAHSAYMWAANWCMDNLRAEIHAAQQRGETQ